MIQLSLSLGVLGRKKSEYLQDIYLKAIKKGLNHEELEDDIVELIQVQFDNDIENYCNTHEIFSNMKVAEDIVKELKQLTE